MSRVFDRVYRIVQGIPSGRVMTYGQVAQRVGTSARAVGWAMSQAPDGVPWHRVVNARGACSTEARAGFPRRYQQSLLEAEGVAFTGQRLDLKRYRHGK